MSKLPLSYLFVPANRPERVIKAIASGARAIIIDLEDAVSPQDKDGARGALVEQWSLYVKLADEARIQILLRINPQGTAWHAADVTVAAMLNVGQVVVPKAESMAGLTSLALAMPSAILYPLLETAQGFERIGEIARSARVGRLMLGAVDLMLDLGVRSDDIPLHHYRTLIVLHSRLAELPAPVDGVCVAFDDANRIAFEVNRAIDFGFGAKLLIHPKQVQPTLAAFAPSQGELEWAVRVRDASAQADGAAVAVDGKMVDRPVLLQAERLIARAADCHNPM